MKGDTVRLEIGREELRRWLNSESELIQGPQPQAMANLVNQAIDEGLALAKPAYGYRVFEVTKVRHNSLVLEGGAIGDEWLASMLAPSHLLALGICTIGQKLEDKARAYTNEGDGALAFFLDNIGTGIVELTRCALLADLDQLAIDQGYECSIPLSPGDTRWSLDQQRRIFDLLPADMVGVSLTPGLVMRPLKSVSLAVGLGPDMGQAAEGSACDYCDIRDRCQLRLARMQANK
jgi:hypothetical protein